MSAIRWIKLSTDLFNDEKIRYIEQLPEADSILTIWVKLLVLTGQKNMGGEVYFNDEIPYTDEMLSAIFHRKVNTVRMALEAFQKLRMIEIAADRTIIICNWAKHQNIDGLDKIRQQTLERVRKYRLGLSPRSNVTDRYGVTPPCVTHPPQIKSRKENSEVPPPVPLQRGTDTELITTASEAKDWLNQLFGRKRAWSDEEDALLAKLLPIARADLELVKWGYSLSRDSEGWTLIDGKRITKPKQSLLVLLREFSSELDKWRSAKADGAEDDLEPKSDGWTPERKQAAFEEFGEEITFPPKFDQLAVDFQRRIDGRIAALEKETGV